MKYCGLVKKEVIFKHTDKLIAYHVYGHIKSNKNIINSLYLTDAGALHIEAGTGTTVFVVDVEMDFMIDTQMAAS